MRQLTESAVNEVVLDGQNLPLCRGEVRNLEHGPEPDVPPAMHGSSGAIADRADSIRSFKLRSARHAPLRSLDATTARIPAVRRGLRLLGALRRARSIKIILSRAASAERLLELAGLQAGYRTCRIEGWRYRRMPSAGWRSGAAVSC
jgi:hypothetical protein